MTRLRRVIGPSVPGRKTALEAGYSVTQSGSDKAHGLTTVNSNSQVTRKDLAVKDRVADTIRAHCVLPGLLTTETGSSEISGTKYMNSAPGLPGDSPRP